MIRDVSFIALTRTLRFRLPKLPCMKEGNLIIKYKDDQFKALRKKSGIEISLVLWDEASIFGVFLTFVTYLSS